MDEYSGKDRDSKKKKPFYRKLLKPFLYASAGLVYAGLLIGCLRQQNQEEDRPPVPIGPTIAEILREPNPDFPVPAPKIQGTQPEEDQSSRIVPLREQEEEQEEEQSLEEKIKLLKEKAEQEFGYSNNTEFGIRDRINSALETIDCYSDIYELKQDEGIKYKIDEELPRHVAQLYFTAIDGEEDLELRTDLFSLFDDYVGMLKNEELKEHLKSEILGKRAEHLLREAEEREREREESTVEEERTEEETPAEIPPLLSLPPDLRLVNELIVGSDQSTQLRRDNFYVRNLDQLFPWMPISEIYAHGFKDKYREIKSNEKVKEEGYGASLIGGVSIFDLAATASETIQERTSRDFGRTVDSNFDITTDTETTEENTTTYLGAKAIANFVDSRVSLTLYRSLLETDIDVETLLRVINLNDPAGNYTQLITSDLENEVETRGALFTVERDLFFAEGSPLLELTVGATGGIERTEIEMDDRKLDAYRLDIHATVFGKDNRWAASILYGDRLFDDGEKDDKFGTPHAHATIAANPFDDLTLFGSFYRLEDPAGGVGMVYGEGNAIKLIMDYDNANAWNNLELLKHINPEDRKIYVDAMYDDFLRGLASGDKISAFLFAGLQRNMYGSNEVDYGFGRAALAIPIGGEVKTIFDGEVKRSANGREKDIKFGGKFLMPGGWEVDAHFGKKYFKGIKDDEVDLVEILIGKSFPF